MEFNPLLIEDIRSGIIVVIDNKNHRNTYDVRSGYINESVKDLLAELAPTHAMNGNGTYYLFKDGRYWLCVPDLDRIPKGAKYSTYTSLEVKKLIETVEEC